MKLNEPNVLKVRLHKIILDREIKPLRVMCTGDWHISPIVSEQQFNYLKEALVKADPDVIILQGDLVDSPVELRRETSLKKLIRELKLCASIAPTVLVLGSHDYIVPSKPPKIMTKHAIVLWKKICQRCGVKLLLNEWFEVPGLRIFGAFQDRRCCIRKNRKGELVHWDKPEGFAENLRDVEELINARISNTSKSEGNDSVAQNAGFDGITWFAAHAPLLNKEVIERLKPFDVASFGHTHGGVVPLGIDEIFDKTNMHFGLISPNKIPLPRRVRGVMPISESTMLIVNPGMIATHFCKPKILQNMNFIKAAEVTVVEVEPVGMDETMDSGVAERNLGEYF